MEGLYSFLLLRESAVVSQEDAESVLLFDTVQPERPIIPDVRFYLTALTDADSELLFRFSVDGVLSLCRGFALPEHVVTEDRDKVHFSEAVFKNIIYFQRRVCAERIQRYAEAVRSKGAPMSTVFGLSTGPRMLCTVHHLVQGLKRSCEGRYTLATRECIA
ncbi:hypothetical protein JG688_00014843 [Phytophthora aleatoria]|uniref:Uncharacterized protein n=1 Tax=Phytophthora aleatoria TaxID=2496075 RepID=A0A8J5IJ61_9STRA|nr:hypothetical protein JG688_00014843 [Phytophthora aleatoria]